MQKPIVIKLNKNIASNINHQIHRLLGNLMSDLHLSKSTSHEKLWLFASHKLCSSNLWTRAHSSQKIHLRSWLIDDGTY